MKERKKRSTGDEDVKETEIKTKTNTCLPSFTSFNRERVVYRVSRRDGGMFHIALALLPFLPIVAVFSAYFGQTRMVAR